MLQVYGILLIAIGGILSFFSLENITF